MLGNYLVFQSILMSGIWRDSDMIVIGQESGVILTCRESGVDSDVMYHARSRLTWREMAKLSSPTIGRLGALGGELGGPRVLPL